LEPFNNDPLLAAIFGGILLTGLIVWGVDFRVRSFFKLRGAGEGCYLYRASEHKYIAKFAIRFMWLYLISLWVTSHGDFIDGVVYCDFRAR